MLCTDGKADGVLFDSLIQQFFLCQLGMSRGGGMDGSHAQPAGGLPKMQRPSLYFPHGGPVSETESQPPAAAGTH